MKTTQISCIILSTVIMAQPALATSFSDDIVKAHREALDANSIGKGFGPQSPRDIDQTYGLNQRVFGAAPHRSQMNLCNIHFHKNAEHAGGQFTRYVGQGDGKGNNTGYAYDGQLARSQLKPLDKPVCGGKGNALQTGDTIEAHFVFSSSDIKPGPTLGACLNDSVMNPGLRVEAQVMVLANDEDAMDFARLAKVDIINGYNQAPNIPSNTGAPVQYLGSTTGPSYNEVSSPLKVTWSVRPKVAIVDINSVATWCDNNVFNESHAHGVRNLVINPKLLSPIL